MYYSDNKRPYNTIGPVTLLAILLMMGVTGCMNPEKSAHFETDLISLNHLLDSVIAESGNDTLRDVSKTIQVSGNEPETRHISNHNILDDLNKLREYEIATPRWADFVKTTRRDSAGFELIRYTLTNKRAPVQHIVIAKKDGNVENLQVHSRKKSAVSEQQVEIDWNPGRGYVFSTESKLLFRQPNTFTMTVTFDEPVKTK